jgi:hypothetical protein
MNCYRFKVIIDHEGTIIRDIEIAMDAPLEDLHKGILLAFGFAQGEMASFYVADGEWARGAEYHLMDMGSDDFGTPYPNMRTTALRDVVAAAGDRLVYVYDFMRMWNFFVELVGENEVDLSELPRLTSETGEAPGQFSKGGELFEDESGARAGGSGRAGADGDGPVLTGDPEIDAFLLEEAEREAGGAGDGAGDGDGPDFMSLDELDGIY